MTFKEAKKLEPGDKIKFAMPGGRELQVVEIEIDEDVRAVFLRCDDGKLYYHTAVTSKKERYI